MAHNPQCVSLSYHGHEGSQGEDLSPLVLYDDEVKEFRNLVMENKWKNVIEKYEKDINYHKINIIGRGTALHMAVNAELKNEVISLVEAILRSGDPSSLKMMNERGATPLHLAASRGFTDLCEVIIGKEGESKYLIQEKNGKGETPLFWAVRGDKTLVFVYLQQFYPLDLDIAISYNNTNILHVAIKREKFDLAIIILYFYQRLSTMYDKYGTLPLEILATMSSVFQARYKLSWWEKILYYCFSVSLDDAKTTMKLYPPENVAQENTKNEIITWWKKILSYCFPVSLNDAKTTMKLNPRENEAKENTKNDEERHSPLNMPLTFNVEELEKEYKIRNSQESLLRWLIMSILGLYIKRAILSLWNFEEIKIIKKKHIYGNKLLHEFMKEHTDSYMGGGDDPLTFTEYDRNQFQEIQETFNKKGKGDTSMQETPENKEMEDSKNKDGKDTQILAIVKSVIAEMNEGPNSKVAITYDKRVKSDVKDTTYLIAASRGINHMMFVLESKIKSVIYDTNSKNENALLLAVKNRQPSVIQYFVNYEIKGVFDNLSQQIDKSGNTMLHLAAHTSSRRENTWRISGVAMQMMWDIKWYKYIKEIAPEHFQNRLNKDGKTPSEIFKTTHEDILKNSADWLKDTAESCSVVAALIAGVSFATSGSVPGGNQQTGEPTLEGQPAFEGFAISSLIGLYFSGTALIMFLAILTSRKEIKDFRIKLPVQLLLGLSSLFISIVAMFVSFCAGHFFVLTDKYTKAGILFYLYISICLPVAFYAVVQVPLFIDLVTIILKKVPPPSIKGVHL